MINGDTEKSSELKRFRMTHSPRNKSGKLFGVAIDFLWKKEKNKTRTQIYLYTKKQLFERRACCLLHSNTRWPQRVRQYSSHPPTPSSKNKIKWEKWGAQRTRKTLLEHGEALEFVVSFIPYRWKIKEEDLSSSSFTFFLFRWWKPREEFLCERQMKQNSLGGLKKGAALAFTCCAPLKIQNWWNIRDDELERETTRAWTPLPFQLPSRTTQTRRVGKYYSKERNR